MKLVEQVTEYITSPQAGVPLGAAPGGLAFLGVALPDWLTLFSLIYVLFLLAHGAWKWYKEYKNGKNQSE